MTISTTLLPKLVCLLLVLRIVVICPGPGVLAPVGVSLVSNLHVLFHGLGGTLKTRDGASAGAPGGVRPPTSLIRFKIPNSFEKLCGLTAFTSIVFCICFVSLSVFCRGQVVIRIMNCWAVFS